MSDVRTDAGRAIVMVEYFKWPDRDRVSYKGFEMEVLGSDAFGHWLWSPPSERPPGADYDSFMTLVATDRWWTATWIRHQGGENKLWVDITTPQHGSVRR